LKECILEPGKNCNVCENCDRCDLDPAKRCDNCCRCLDIVDYRAIEITEIILPVELKIKKEKSNPKKPE